MSYDRSLVAEKHRSMWHCYCVDWRDFLVFLCLFLTKINLYPSVVLFSFPSLESWGSSFYLGQNLVWGSHLTKTHSFLWVVFPYSQNCERFQSCWWLFLSSVITPLLSCEAFCLGGSPDCTVSLSQSSVSCLLATHCVWDMFFSLRVLFLVFCLYSWFSHPLPLWLLCSLTFLLSRRHRHLPVSLQLLRWDCVSQCGTGVLGLSQWKGGHCVSAPLLQSALPCLSGEVHKALRAPRACLFCRNDI